MKTRSVPKIYLIIQKCIRSRVITFKNFLGFHPASLPAIRPTRTRCMGPVFGTTKVITIRITDLLFWSRFIYCVMLLFILQSFITCMEFLRHIIHLLAHAVNVNTNFNYFVLSTCICARFYTWTRHYGCILSLHWQALVNKHD